ncbi:hypothetical protein L227DRAFT_67699 [Lentinus tigrinus ALCF2SS1-6]|uniref:F-box domain-containing protein n=1 Tax=Lentinus tigrinus ALCF2SS1-6 TaxID=1328759 RepID=A0A5C2SDR2_9APHY|nr:hypothetical protein L227DRAFT_67699 [Lentinus tigrinus ALCF2SS1-6]
MPPPYIPPEVTDDIISAVAVDECSQRRAHTLAMCALVCRDWLPRSRAKLFEYICIEDQRSYDLLVQRIARSETMVQYLTSVTTLHIDDSHVEHSLSSAVRLFFVEFTGKLPGLRDLLLDGIYWTHQRPSVKWPLLLSQFRTITSLRLWSCRFSSFNDVRRMLTALPLLSILDIAYLEWPAVSQLHLQTTPRSRTYWPELHTLYIEYSMTLWQCAETFLKWITPALGGSAVKELTFHFYGLHTP